jgi:hypothetical protein
MALRPRNTRGSQTPSLTTLPSLVDLLQSTNANNANSRLMPNGTGNIGSRASITRRLWHMGADGEPILVMKS